MVGGRTFSTFGPIVEPRKGKGYDEKGWSTVEDGEVRKVGDGELQVRRTRDDAEVDRRRVQTGWVEVYP